MKERTKITLMLGGIVLLVIGVISASFAFFSITKKQDIANNFTSGCLNISIENESNAITLNNTYPITDLEGLKDEGYIFTIKNTCSTSTNYQINLESLNQITNTLDTQYIKTSLSSDTMDNLIQKLDSSMVTKAYIENAYVSHNLYKGTINGNSTKEFNLKLWIDYDTTKEQGASKTYTSKINVIANPDLEVETTPEIKTALVDNTLEGIITGSATTAQYCTTSDNICMPNQDITITDNKINIEVDRTKNKNQIVCFNINNEKVTCSNMIEKLPPITIDDIIAANNPKTDAPTFTNVATTDEGVYSILDGMYGGVSYYWRGAVTNNYVKFANKCWRIVRINGDKTIRLIYDGTTCHANGTKNGESIAVKDQVYYSSPNRGGENVGYTFTKGSQRGTATASNLKIQNEIWYANNLISYADKIADGKFCNDRNMASGYSWSLEPKSRFYYAGYDRSGERSASSVNPTLECSNASDVYTLKIGAITMDEVVMAGAKWGTENSNYYLCNGGWSYWTMSPCYWNGTNFYLFLVHSDGQLTNYNLSDLNNGVRPVINLKADTLFTTGGTGTQSNPYVVID